jgi:hypothetical protein
MSSDEGVSGQCGSRAFPVGTSADNVTPGFFHGAIGTFFQVSHYQAKQVASRPRREEIHHGKPHTQGDPSRLP